MASVSVSSAKRTTIIRPKKKVKQPEPEPEPEPEPVALLEPETEPEPQNKPTTPAMEPIFVPYCDPELFKKQQIKRRLTVPFYKITRHVNVTELLATELAKQLEGYCSIEGYICPNSVSIYSHSCGTLAAANIVYDIVADCLVCFPDEHTVIKCVAKTITQAGIRACATQLMPGRISPIEVFLSRDMNNNNELFPRIEENDILTVEIIGRRFVLHDTHVTIIAMLLDAASPSSPSLSLSSSSS
jgi:hypothetical protein